MICPLEIPIEIWNNIMHLLSPDDLLKISIVSKRFLKLSTSRHLWRSKCNSLSLENKHSTQHPKEIFKEYISSRNKLLKDNHECKTIVNHRLGVFFIKSWSDDGIASIGWDGRINLHEILNDNCKIINRIQTDAVDCASLSDNYIVLGSRGSFISILHIPSLANFTIPTRQPAIALDHSKNHIIVACPTRVYIYSLTNRNLIDTITVSDVVFVKLTSDGIFMASGNGVLEFWTIPTINQTSKCLFKNTTDKGLISVHVSCIKNEFRIFCGYKEGHSREYIKTQSNFKSGNIFKSTGKDWVCSMCVFPESLLLVTGSWDNKIRMYDFNGELLKEFSVKSTPLGLFKKDASSLIIGGYDGSISIYRFQ